MVEKRIYFLSGLMIKKVVYKKIDCHTLTGSQLTKKGGKMEQNKLPKEIFNVKQENIEKLKKLFPSAIKDGQLDVKALKEELGTFEEVGQEKYEMSWAGKQKAKQIAQTSPLGKTLKYVKGDGVNEDTTGNIYIEGDNLEVLKLLRKNYYGSIKMIYIDPPYNTGNDFIYKDNFCITQQQLETAQGQRTEEGEKLQKNTKEGNAKYHTNWLNMMYPRLKLAKDLLTNDGVIFISIDDNEQANLKKICDEIFGEENFIANFPRVTKRGGKSTETFSKNHDYFLVYSKNNECVKIKGIEHIDEGFKYKDEYFEQRGYYKLNQTLDYNTLQYNTAMDFPIEINNKIFVPGGDINLHKQRHNGIHGKHDWVWRWSKSLFDFGYKNGWIVISATNRIYTKTYLNATISKNSNGEYYIEYKKRTKALSTLNFTENNYSNDNSNKEITNLMGTTLFDYVKPMSLIKQCMLTVTDKDSIILDFFSGSATTAHAVMQLNAEDGGNRKFIMVQLPELCDEKSEAYKAGYKNICEIGKERIRRAGKKIQQENPDKKTDIGFKVFKIDDTTLNWEKAEIEGKDLYSDYNENNTEKDKLDFTPGFTDLDVVYEIMLRQEGLSLTSKIEQLTDIGSRTYLVANSYLICLEDNITEQIINKLAELEITPIKFVFRDSAFDDDIALKDESFRLLSALIDKNKGAVKQAYTIEFI